MASDTGTGMSGETAARAFEPFFTTKPAGQGTGLGLATVYGIVTQAGGNARIYSEPGHGTLVSINLPAVDEPAVTPTDGRDATPAPGGSGEAILVVEDEPAVLLAATRILGTNGYSVIAKSSPADALATLADPQTRVDVLLTDVVMPGMSGIELARQAREVRRGLRVIYMSGYSHEVIGHQGAIPAGSALLQKPFTRKALLEVLRGTLASHA